MVCPYFDCLPPIQRKHECMSTVILNSADMRAVERCCYVFDIFVTQIEWNNIMKMFSKANGNCPYEMHRRNWKVNK